MPVKGKRARVDDSFVYPGETPNRGAMKENRFFASLVMLTTAGALTLGGCSKNSNQPAGSAAAPPQNPQQMAAAPPAPGNGTGPARGGYAEPPPPMRARPPVSSPAPPPTVVIPNGTPLRVRLDQDLGSKISQTGDSFSATLADDVSVDGTTVIPRGSRAEGAVIDARPLGRFKGAALLEVRLERVRTNWGSYPVATSTIERAEAGKGRRSAEFIGGGGGLGALIGGLAGGGKGALIGALAGAGAGTAGTAFTGNKQIVLPAETMLTFRLEQPVRVAE